MSNNSSSAAGLFGCLFPSFFLVGLIVLTLKLAQVGLPATWSWWFVLLPWYIVPLGFVIFLIVIFGGAFILDQFQAIARWHRRRKQRARVKKNDAEIAARAEENDAFFKRTEEADRKRRGIFKGDR